MDAFGKPYVEVVHDVSDPTPVSVIGRRDAEFYDDVGIYEADVVKVEGEEQLPIALHDHEEVSSSGSYDLYIDSALMELGLEFTPDEEIDEIAHYYLDGFPGQAENKRGQVND